MASTLALLPLTPAHAAAGLTITKTTWNVIGLDSNRPSSSAIANFPVGARICNSGDATTSGDVTLTFTQNALGGNPPVELAPGFASSFNVGPLAPGACAQRFATVSVIKHKNSFGATRTITMTGSGSGLTNAATTQSLYVAQLVSQNRNAVVSIVVKDSAGATVCNSAVSNACTLFRGQAYTTTLNAKSAPGGYSQTEAFLNLPASLMAKTVKSYYATPAGGTAEGVYADACGWNETTRACVGPARYTGGTAGGNPIKVVYTMDTTAVSSSFQVGAMIYDLSGGSYHYNGDSGTLSHGLSVTVAEGADLKITKSHTNAFVKTQQKPYTIAVQNLGPTATNATGVTVTDTLPPEVEYNSSSGVGWNACTASGTLAVGKTVTCTRSAAIAVGDTATVTLNVTPTSSAAASVTNAASVAITGTVLDPISINNSTTDVATVAADPTQSDLVVTNAAIGSFSRGGIGSYTIGVSNGGPAAIVNGTAVTITDTIPAGLTPTSAAGAGWTCNITGQTVACTSTSGLAAGAASGDITIAVNVGADAPDSVTNTVSGTYSTPVDANAANNVNVTRQTTIGRADLELTKTHTGSFGIPVAGGSRTGQFTLTVKNTGPDAANGPITITDTLPTGLTFASSTGTGWTCPATLTQTVTCTRDSALASGASSSVVLTVNVSSSLTEGSLTNTATVGGVTSDPDSSDNTAEDVVEVVKTQDVSISALDSPDPVTAGGNITYSYTTTLASGTGLGNASNVYWVTNVPTGTSFVSVEPDGAGALTNSSCSFPETADGFFTGEVVCSLGTMTPGQSITSTLVVSTSGSSPTTVSDSVSVFMDQVDSNATNDAAAATTAVTGGNTPPAVVVTLGTAGPYNESSTSARSFSWTATDSNNVSSVTPSCGLAGTLQAGSTTSGLGTSSASGSFSCIFDDGAATSDVVVSATDAVSTIGTASNTVTINNVAPTGTFTAPAGAATGSTFGLSLTSPSDVSSNDTTAGFTYAFDCGTGYGDFGSSSSTSCTASAPGTTTVKGKIQDKDGGVTEYSGSVAVTNTPPTATDRAVSTTEDTPVVISLQGVDANDQATTFAIVSPPTAPQGTLGAIGSVTCSSSSGTKTCNANVTFTPTANFVGSPSFTYKANDGGADSTNATVSITVNGVNDVPVAQAVNGTTPPGVPKSITLSATDLDNEDTTFSIVTAPDAVTEGTLSTIGSVTCSGSGPKTCTATVTFTPGAGVTGVTDFTYKANDGTSDSNTATVSIDVTSVNTAPAALDVPSTTGKNVPRTVTLTATDVDNNTTTLSIVAIPDAAEGTLGAVGSVTCSGVDPKTCTASVTFTPTADFTGSAVFTYKANDGASDSNVSTVTVTVSNTAPAATARSATTNEDTPVTVTLEAVDTNGDATTFSIVSPPTGGTLGSIGPVTCSSASGSKTCSADVVFTPTANTSGAPSFTYKANDGGLDSANAIVDLTVNAVNDVPVAQAVSATTPRDTAKSLILTATDIDNDVSSFAIVAGPTAAEGTLGSVGTATCTGSGTRTCTATVTFTPALGLVGPADFTFKGNDGTGDSNVATVSIDVTATAINVAPVASSQTGPNKVTTAEDATVMITLAATDADGDALTYRVTALPTHGTAFDGSSTAAADEITSSPAVISGNTLTFVPSPDYNNGAIPIATSFGFTATDGGGSNTASPGTVQIDIDPVNDDPSWDATVAMPAWGSLDLRSVSSDLETATADLTYVMESNGSRGTATLTGSMLTFAQNGNDPGVDSVVVKVIDRGDTDGCGPPAAGTCAAPKAATKTVTIVLQGEAPLPTPIPTPTATPTPTPSAPVTPDRLPGPRVRLGIPSNTPIEDTQAVWRTGLMRCEGNERTFMELHKRVDEGFMKVGRVRLDGRCRGTFTVRVNFEEETIYRAVWPQQNEIYRKGRSSDHHVSPRFVPLGNR